MLIHHQNGAKSQIQGLKKTMRTEHGCIMMCYDDPITKAKGIVEIRPDEVQEIITALSSNALNDITIMKAFAGIKPTDP